MRKQFETESKKILDLMINSIYTNKEIFLRELISNASDAIDKRYYNLLNDSGDEIDRKDFEIFIETDPKSRILKIKDNGIGMNSEDLENNLGTIAKSGSLDFKSMNKDDEISIIGQFGVGFYSAFMVADKITVETKKLGDKAYKWVSEGADGYEILDSDKEDIGTEITLHLKENTEDDNYDEFLESGFIQYLVKKYSNYIKYPIKMEIEKSRPIEGEEGGFEDYTEIDVLNSMVPIWRKNKSEVSDEEYKSFYHAQRYGFDDPLAWLHLSAEGVINYKSILYIPSQKPMQFYTSNYSGGLELYSNGVMIMEKNEDILPDYLSFVKGIVDSEDLSLNISREILQNDRKLLSIGKNLEKRILQELKKILNSNREEYEKFFKEFGLSLKAGIYESQGAKKKDLEDLLLFKSSKEGKLITLEEYLENKNDNQEFIYYATGESYDSIDRLPALQIFKKKDIEVIYLDEHIDEFVIKIMEEFRDVKFKSAFEDDIKFDGDESEEKEESESDKSNKEELISRMKSVLGDEVVEIKTSSRLIDDASFLSAKGDISIEMEKTLAMQETPFPMNAQKVLEINPEHILYKKLMDALSKNDEETIKTITEVLYNQARLVQGLKVNDIVEYNRLINSLIKF